MDREMIEKIATEAAGKAVQQRPLIDASQSHVNAVHGNQIALAVLSALNEAGCVVVPREPTEAMLDAASDAMGDIEDYSTTRVEYAAAAYTAALTAA